MLLGEFRHTLDTKNRLSLPAKFRSALGKKVVVTHGYDRCLSVYALPAWKRVSERYASAPAESPEARALARFFLAGACEVDVDTAGRILIPDYLKKYAGLSGKAVVAGVSDRAEIWEEGAWEKYARTVEKTADQLAEKLAQKG